ncbi:MAG: hypothetical protein H0V66_07835 [Bdellovibrionales bacterium]|nr:hypothetical protein [Bdellovibrionales bacterium]
MKNILLLLPLLFLPLAQAQGPDSYTDLLDYVQPAPDQGKTGTCLFVATTGAIELLMNKQQDLRHPEVMGANDFSEPFLIHAPYNTPAGKSFFEAPAYKFNQGFTVSAKEWLFLAWIEGRRNMSAWDNQDYSKMSQVEVPKIETIKLFNMESRWATKVLNPTHIQKIKDALIKYESPILVNYNDNNYWHVILIVGYDDKIEGDCYQTLPEMCNRSNGSFYVRDSFGITTEVRDYDWFLNKGNAAFVFKFAPEL